jgi:predicted metal-dependent HD superfamily phosphohydrolase
MADRQYPRAFDHDSFDTPWRALGARDTDAFERVRDGYRSAGRHYHTEEHVLECLQTFEPARPLAERPDEVETALWFHDVVYDPRRHDNEERSADLVRAAAFAAGIAADVAERIAALVSSTSHHDAAESGDRRLICDVDLAILAAPEERYRRYEADIRREYAHVPEPLYRLGRRRVLARFLRRERIYQTAHFWERLEARARANLTAAMATLRGLKPV